MSDAIVRLGLLLSRVSRAWSYYRKLNYSWRLAWAKADRVDFA